LVSALYAKMDLFEEFASLTLLYFAAMSFTETAWRLGKTELASCFLLTNERVFSNQRIEICAAARAGYRISRDQIEHAIAPYDIAGLSDWNRKNWYPVDLRDVTSNAHKVGATNKDLELLFRKMGITIAA
jgi:FADH2 O2-dependent halogenase